MKKKYYVTPQIIVIEYKIKCKMMVGSPHGYQGSLNSRRLFTDFDEEKDDL